jgi:cytochrome P450
LLDAALPRGAFDLVQDFASPLPVIMIAEMLGVEPERREDFKRWSDAVIHLTAGGAKYGDMPTYMQSWQKFKEYFSQIIEARRRSPRNDLVSALVQAQDERDALTLNEILNFCLLLLVAGNETTTNLITNGALALYTHEAQRQKLRGQPQLIQSAIEEILRYDGPIQGVFRTTTRDVEVRGSTIAAQSKVLLLWASANRDPDVFPDPDRFDIERTPNDHMAFGRGIHFCLGAPLARLEARIATQTILRRTKVTRPDPEGVRERVDNALFRGLKRFPVVVEPANAA